MQHISRKLISNSELAAAYIRARAGGPVAASRMCCRRVAPLLLTHVNLLLAMYAGGALVTAARLKWDPSTYVPVRELFPMEYRVSAVMLAAAGFTLLVLAQLAIAALALRRHSRRRLLLFLYGAAMSALAAAELSWAAWAGARLLQWAHSPQAAELLEALQLRDTLRPVLEFLGRWHPLPYKLKNLMEEAEADVPRNLWVVGAAAVLLVVLQPLAVLLALMVACRSGHKRRISLSCATTATTATSAATASTDSEKAPLRTAYKNGRIVIL